MSVVEVGGNKQGDENMTTVISAYGHGINYQAAVDIMDDEIREELHGQDGLDTEQAFYDAYAAADLAEHGEEWELDSANPTW